MDAWWINLNFDLQIFYGIGILALLVLALQTVLTLFVGLEHDLTAPDASGDHGFGAGLFSVRGITAFFLGFGWGGVIGLQAGLPLWGAIGLGMGIGVFLMLLMLVLLRAILRLQSSGTLNYANAVGQVGTVYVTIQPGQKAGGQVELLLQGRLIMADAIYPGLVPIAPGTKVKVIEKIGTSTLLVQLL